MASGAGGGAQVHVQNLVERLPKERFDVDVVTLSDGPAVRRIRATGAHGSRHRRARRRRCLRQRDASFLEARPPDILHNHMFRAEVIGTRAALRSPSSGCPSRTS